MLNLGKILKAKKISQKEIAICCGVSQPTVSEWISGRKNPSLENLTKLSRYLDISVDCILGENSEEQKDTTPVSEDDIKVALFGGAENVTDEMWEEVKNFAEFVKNKNKK